MKRIFKRKLYDRLQKWKDTRNGKTAILVEGARRVGKSTLVEQFAKNEYVSYILIDFNKASKRVMSLFDDLILPTTASDIQCEPHSQKFRHHFR